MSIPSLPDARNFVRSIHDLNFAISQALRDLAAQTSGPLSYHLITVAYAAELGADKASHI